ncbi:MAG: hypothetical protein IJ594_04955 [Oscillospiraceae bacterium]|nr:hypothetical protein [Oscillospiraceae bacterium]
MIKAILYNTQTGSCKRYAEELSRTLVLPVYSVDDHPAIADGEVIYVSWVMAGSVVGYAKVKKQVPVAAVCAVGMAPAGPYGVKAGREKNKVPASVGYFCLQGGFNINKLPLPMKLIMQWKVKDIAKRLESKRAKTPLSAQEQATYVMATRGQGEPASWDVSEVVAWARSR